MNSRERIKMILNFKIPDRIGIFDAPWPETTARWHREGLPESLSPHEYFDFDMDYCLYLDTSFMLPEKILEENEEFVIFSNTNGAIEKCWRKKTGVPVVLDYPIKSLDDWRKYKPFLKVSFQRISARRWGDYVLPETRLFEKEISLQQDVFSKYQNARRRGKFIFLYIPGPFETVSKLINSENLYIGLVESPEMFEDIFNAITALIVNSLSIFEKNELEPDGIFLSDDIAYKNGMLFSPRTYRRLLLPSYQVLSSFFAKKGLNITFHTDGNLKEVLPLLLEGGIKAIQPLEAKAGNDVRELKKAYNSKLTFIGNINAITLGGNKDEIEEEIESKISIAKEGGGYIYHSDHSVPPTVSFENYEYAMKLVKKCGKY